MTGARSNAVLAIWWLAALCAASAGARAAERPVDFYAGRNVQFLIGAPADSSFDAYARLIGQHMIRYIPGSPSVVFKNMPDAEGRKAAAWLHDRAPSDGSVIGAVQAAALMAPLLADRKIARTLKYDPLRFVYLGSAARAVRVCIFRRDAPIQSFADLRKQPLILGADRGGGPLTDMPRVLTQVLGARFRMVSAYRDLSQTIRAMEEGEVHGVCGCQYSVLRKMRPDLMANDKFVFRLQFALKGHSDLHKRKVPMMWKFARSDSDRDVLRVLAAPQVFARPYLVSPGVPAHRVGLLRSAFERTLKDADFHAAARRAGLDLYLSTGREVETLLRELYDAPGYVVERARRAHLGGE